MKNLAILAVLAATCAPAFAQGVKTETKAQKKTEMAADGTTKTTTKATRTMKGEHKGQKERKGHDMRKDKKAAM